jgi:transposase
MRNGGSWRDLPASFGPWQTLYTRYRRWHKAGIWQHILETINPERTC